MRALARARARVHSDLVPEWPRELNLLNVEGVDRSVVVIALDVRVDVRAMLAGVDAVRTPEARRLAALVLEMPVEAAVPLVGLATRRALEGAACRGVDRRRARAGVATTSACDDERRSAVAGVGANVESCKAQVVRQLIRRFTGGG